MLKIENISTNTNNFFPKCLVQTVKIVALVGQKPVKCGCLPAQEADPWDSGTVRYLNKKPLSTVWTTPNKNI